MRLVLLDRDGTLVAPAPAGQRYLQHPDEVVLLPRVTEAVGELNRRGIDVAVVTNQRGIATGVVSAAECEAIHVRISELLAPRARIDAWFVCPHDVGQCSCRKPGPGLVLDALERFGVAPSQAVMVGNAESDLLAGSAAGVRGIGVGVSAAPEGTVGLAWRASLDEAVALILGDSEPRAEATSASARGNSGVAGDPSPRGVRYVAPNIGALEGQCP